MKLFLSMRLNEKVLLVEDLIEMQAAIKTAMSNFCDLTMANNLAEAKTELLKTHFALLLLDVNLPDGSGFEFCAQLRQSDRFRELPIILITGEASIDDKVRGFTLGADDYIVKPFLAKELIARVQAKLSRRSISAAAFSKGDIRIDMATQQAFLSEQRLDLTPIEFKLLVQFLRNEEKIFSRTELRDSVWGGTHISNHTVDTHISSLRKKIGSWGPCLKSIVKKGYIFSMSELQK